MSIPKCYPQDTATYTQLIHSKNTDFKIWNKFGILGIAIGVIIGYTISRFEGWPRTGDEKIKDNEETMTTLIVNGQERELTMDFPGHDGIDISADFIGNTEHGMEEDDEGRYIATEEDFQWWKRVIADHESLERMVADYRESFNSDDVDSVVQAAVGSTDLEDQPGRGKAALIEAFGIL
jgi:hypothetical protein